MAGSFNHIVDKNGDFKMSSIENMGDAHEALEDCFNIIKKLQRDKFSVEIRYAIDGVNPKTVFVPPSTVPIVGDYFIPDMETRNGYKVIRRNVFADGSIQLYLEK